jgi:hypothetical protein
VVGRRACWSSALDRDAREAPGTVEFRRRLFEQAFGGEVSAEPAGLCRDVQTIRLTRWSRRFRGGQGTGKGTPPAQPTPARRILLAFEAAFARGVGRRGGGESAVAPLHVANIIAAGAKAKQRGRRVCEHRNISRLAGPRGGSCRRPAPVDPRPGPAMAPLPLRTSGREAREAGVRYMPLHDMSGLRGPALPIVQPPADASAGRQAMFGICYPTRCRPQVGNQDIFRVDEHSLVQ